jgi:hypothetical protein
MRQYKDRVCPRCTETYTPTGANQVHCDNCRTRIGVNFPEKPCELCGQTFKPRSRLGKYCKRCRRKQSATIGRERYILEMGGRCARCGYDEFVEGIQLHHIDPGNKTDAYAGSNREEADKCIPLCASCHQSLHAGCWTTDFLKAGFGWRIAT